MIGPEIDRADEILTPAALEFGADPHRRFAGRRDETEPAGVPGHHPRPADISRN
ncbi:MAG TPA: hypothetical protein VIU11_03900 [Nakamurella sp.]